IIANQTSSETNSSSHSRKNLPVLSSNHNNINKNANECFETEKVNKLYNEGNDVYDDGIRSQPLKRRRTATHTKIIDKKTDNNDECFDSDSSSTQNWHDFIFGKEDDPSSDEEDLSDDEVPRGWKKVYRKKRQWS
ncbi:unnamed protein product, partial [Rotaria sp. Silwood2]